MSPDHAETSDALVLDAIALALRGYVENGPEPEDVLAFIADRVGATGRTVPSEFDGSDACFTVSGTADNSQQFDGSEGA